MSGISWYGKDRGVGMEKTTTIVGLEREEMRTVLT